MAPKTTITLDVTGPDGVTASTSSQDESIIIGSGAGAALQVVDPLISNLHCMLKLERGRVTVIDLGSASGTRVRDRAIREPVVLESGDTIALGASKIRVTVDGSSVQPSLVRVLPSPVEPAAEPRGRSDAPTERDKILQVTHRWGSTVLESRLVAEQTWVTIGDGPECDHLVPEAGPRFELAQAKGTTITVQVPASAEIEVATWGDEARDGRALRAQGRLLSGPQGERIELGLRERAKVRVGGLSFDLGFVRPPTRAAAVPLGDRDFNFFKIVCICFLSFLALVAAIAVTPRSEGGEGDALFANPSRYVNLVVKPEKQQTLSKLKDLAQARQRAKEQEGKFGKQEAQRREADPSRRGAPLVDPNKREDDRRKVSLLMAGMFGGGASSNVFGPGGLGTGINNALGGLKGGAGAGDAQGLGGLGARGTGSGGGGTGLGLGGLGTRGGSGGSGTLDLGGRGKDTTRIIPGKTTIVGGLDRDVIMKVINRHQNEIKFCYEAELQKHPELAGKVAVAWTIDPKGMVADASVSESSMGNANVESCILERIRRWKFPEPEGGGVVAVTFPWIFKVAGGE